MNSSTRYYNFMQELKSLLKKHDVRLFASTYDTIQVWDGENLDPSDDYFEVNFENKL